MKIGQVVYIISKKNQTIVPAIIHEENVCKRIDGEQITYKVLIGEPNKAKLIDLSKIDTDVFSSVDEVRDHLLTNFTKILDEACSNATTMSQKWYGHLLGQNQTQQSNGSPGEELFDEIASQMSPNNSNEVMVQLPDGRMVPAV